MIRLLSGIATIAIVGLAGSAAADTSSGHVAAVDSTRHMVTLASGQTFELGTGIDSKKLERGDRVMIEYHTYQKGYPLAEQVTKFKDGARMMMAPDVKSSPVSDAHTTSGHVAAVDTTRHMVTLASGQTFELGTGIKSSDLAVGDRVVVEHHFFQKGYPLAEQIVKFKDGQRVILPRQVKKPRL